MKKEELTLDHLRDLVVVDEDGNETLHVPKNEEPEDDSR